MTASKDKNYANAYYKRPTMSVSDGVALANKRNKKQDEGYKKVEIKRKKKRNR
jgi:hypothetical protein